VSLSARLIVPLIHLGMVFVGTPYGQNPQILVTDGIGGSPLAGRRASSRLWSEHRNFGRSRSEPVRPRNVLRIASEDSPLLHLCLKGSKNPEEVEKSETACTVYLAV
jgi:hypothetical protein